MIIILDLDHTVSDALWRDSLLGRWQEYHEEGQWDRPICFVRDIVDYHWFTFRDEIVVVTARPEWNRGMTIRWLYDNGVPADRVLMRPPEDHRPGAEVKESLVREHIPDLLQVRFVLEDRDDCVAVYRQLGLNVLQVYKGVDNAQQATSREEEIGRSERQAPGPGQAA